MRIFHITQRGSGKNVSVMGVQSHATVQVTSLKTN